MRHFLISLPALLGCACDTAHTCTSRVEFAFRFGACGMPDVSSDVRFLDLAFGSDEAQDVRVELAPGQDTPIDMALCGDAIPFRIRAVARRQDESIVGVSLPVYLQGAQAIVTIVPVERFAPLAITRPAGGPPACPRLLSPRAGHTFNVLPGNRLVAAGGYAATDATVATWNYLDDAEVMSLDTGGHDRSAKMRFGALVEPRALHGASVLADGRLVVVGGEARQSAALVTWNDALVFDANANAWTRVAMALPRTRAGVGADGQGRVLVTGGFLEMNGTYGTAEAYEWFEPQTMTFVHANSSVRLRRSGHGIALLASATTFLLAGGIDGAARLSDVTRLRFNSATGYLPEPTTTVSVDPPRYGATLLKLADGAAVLVGGYASTDVASPVQAVAATDLFFETPRADRKAGPALATARGRGCGALLPDGRALYVGGLAVATSMATARSVGDVTAFSLAGDAATAAELPPLVEPRADAACAVLEDGSVVVAGGVRVEDGAWATLDSIERFVPAPR